MSSEIEKVTTEPLATVPANESPLAMLSRLACDATCDVAKLDKLVGLAERLEAQVAAKAFATALAAFQATCPPIVKNRTTKKASQAGGKFDFGWADLASIAQSIRPALAEHGLSYAFDSVHDDKGQLAMTCRLSHAGGHSTESTIRLPCETSLNVSAQQKVGSATTYAMRYALVQALGLTTVDSDNDGAEPMPAGPTITPEQVTDLEDLIIEAGADRAKFLRFLQVGKLGDLEAGRFDAAVEALNAKIKAKQ